MLMLLTERVYENGRLGERPVLIDQDDIETVRTVFGVRARVEHFGNQITFKRKGWFRREPVYVIESIEHIATMCAAVDARWNAGLLRAQQRAAERERLGVEPPCGLETEGRR